VRGNTLTFFFMALSGHIKDREFDKFTLVEGETAVRTTATGTFTFSGVSKELKITNEIIGATAQQLPTTPLTDRNTLIIHNKGAESIFIGNSDVQSSGIDEGWEIAGDSFFSTDIANDIPIYAISVSGGVPVKILELA